MAEQKSEETKPAARRAVRPFVGPAGASAGTRPLLRPAAPGDRPRPAAFAPALPPERASLGVEHAADPAAHTAPAAAAVPVSPVEDATSIAYDATSSMPAASPDAPSVAMPALEADVSAHVPTPIASTPIRPVTSEMVAIDAFDAFESVWGAPEPVMPPAPEGVGSPLDELSLGGGLDGPHLWTDEITAVPEQALSAATDPVSLDETSALDAVWPEPATADIGIPPWLVDDPEPVVSSAIDDDLAESAPVASSESAESYEVVAAPSDVVAAEVAMPDLSPITSDADDPRWPDPLLAEYAPYIPTPSSISTIVPIVDHSATSLEPTGVDAHSAEPDVGVAPEMTADADTISADLSDAAARDAVPAGPEIRVSAALERLADRVRSGEIDVSSVAAEAPDAAVLASVLAALLGGSNSR